ncbi:MAG: hypothetical protein KatS3mg102_1341 [Planctomycetota bacterium]|nr:MAG: hypothetical protein KatS3mg102_1341 [Planctomycetota bacterium]
MVRVLLALCRLLDGGLYALELLVVSLGLALMVGLYSAQVLMRNLEWGGVPWFQTVVQHLVLWVGMLGASLCVRDRKHIAVEVIAKSATAGGRRVVEGLVDASTMLLCLLLAFIAWRYIGFYERDPALGMKVLFELGGVQVQRWWSLCVVPAAFVLMAFRYLRLLLESIFAEHLETAEDEIRREMHTYERRLSSEEWEPGEPPAARPEGRAAGGPAPPPAQPGGAEDAR